MSCDNYSLTLESLCVQILQYFSVNSCFYNYFPIHSVRDEFFEGAGNDCFCAIRIEPQRVKDAMSKSSYLPSRVIFLECPAPSNSHIHQLHQTLTHVTLGLLLLFSLDGN